MTHATKRERACRAAGRIVRVALAVVAVAGWPGVAGAVNVDNTDPAFAPGVVGAGSVNAIVADPHTPSTVYIGTTCSGVLKTTDAGATWAATGLRDTRVSALAFDPVTQAMLYAGLEYGGVLRTTDAGATWTWTGSSGTNALAIDPKTPTTLYVGTGVEGVLRSTDRGANWTAIDTGLSDRNIASLVIDPATPATLYAGTEISGVFRSTNSGGSWRAINAGLPDYNPHVSLAIDPHTPSTLYAGTGRGVFQSTNSGASWSAVNAGLTTAFRRVWVVAIDPTSPNTLYAGTGGGVFRSTNGGGAWVAINSGLDDVGPVGVTALAIDPTTPGTLYAGGGGLFKSTDAGTTWHAASVVADPICGDGLRSCGEECDDGNLMNGDACDANCTLPRCGNGIVDAGEACDDGNGTNADGCENDCTLPRCGNGIVDPVEECDDGNSNPFDGCTDGCTICGNGVVTPPEECDDGNGNPLDGCTTACTVCGNGVVTPPEDCDDANSAPSDGCTNGCTTCGNGVVTPPERCDDGNRVDSDACDAACRVGAVAVGTGTPGSCTETALDAALAGGRAVTFACGAAPVTLTISHTKTIAADTSIDGGSVVTVRGGITDQVFAVPPGVTFDLRNLTIAGGGVGEGVGIRNDGTLTVSNSTIAGNTGGGIVSRCGSTTTVTNSTVRGNASSSVGGGILCGRNPGDSDGCGLRTTLNLVNCTITGNSAVVAGGGIYVNDGAIATLTNCTLHANSVGGGVAYGGGLVNEGGFVTLTNTVIVNSTGGNCYGAITDDGHNVQWPGTTCGGTIGSLDPKLASEGLQDNGGLTQTIALQPGSAAINAGDRAVCASPPVSGLDQRGYTRPGTGTANCSIGAYEYNSPGPPASCAGDCTGNWAVSVDELVMLVNIALGRAASSTCPAGDWNGDSAISIDEIILAVNATLTGCPAGARAPHVTIETYPAIDGSTSTLPLARVIACELLGLSYRWEPWRGPEGEAEIVPVATTPEQEALAAQVLARIVFNKTHQAYLNLVDGVADVITVANPPSPEERAYADAHGVTLVWEPLALDALVIVLNASNSVRGLTTEHIQRIYMGEITNWSEVGGVASAIRPYVRPENSGSQQLFNTIVMQGRAMAAWPPDRQASGMGGLIDMVSADPEAIGYSVYYWVTYQYPNEGYSVIAVDGVAPTAETIGARSYPFTAEVWIVTRSNLDRRSLARQLHEWMLSPGGQQAVARSGYVPILR